MGRVTRAAALLLLVAAATAVMFSPADGAGTDAGNDASVADITDITSSLDGAAGTALPSDRDAPLTDSSISATSAADNEYDTTDADTFADGDPATATTEVRDAPLSDSSVSATQADGNYDETITAADADTGSDGTAIVGDTPPTTDMGMYFYGYDSGLDYHDQYTGDSYTIDTFDHLEDTNDNDLLASFDGDATWYLQYWSSESASRSARCCVSFCVSCLCAT